MLVSWFFLGALAILWPLLAEADVVREPPSGEEECDAVSLLQTGLKLHEETGFVRNRVRGLQQQEVLIRYAALQPNAADDYFKRTGWPQLRTSMCHVERHLAPELLANSVFAALPSYLIYTDNQTDGLLAERLRKYMPKQAARVKLINLDVDADDVSRMAPFKKLMLDEKNLASVRRTLADAKHLPPSTGRLLLGTDVTFLAPPLEFVRRASQLKTGEALYMTEMCWGDDTLYTLANYSRPQCAGLLADFFYLGPGVNMTLENLGEKMLWYAEQPDDHNGNHRLVPPIPLDEMGLHGIDQYGVVLGLAEAVQTRDGKPGCFPLDSKLYVSRCHPKPNYEFDKLAEAVHDKGDRPCKVKRNLLVDRLRRELLSKRNLFPRLKRKILSKL